MNQIRSWLLLMATVSLIGITVLAIKNPDKFGRNIVEITTILLTSVIALAKQNDDKP